MEEDKYKVKVGGRQNGKTLKNVLTLNKYIDELEPHKMYGIIRCGRGSTLLTKEQVFPVSRIKKKIDVLENLQNEFKDNEELRIKIIAYKELLKELEE